MHIKDYYKTLHCTLTASQQDIKKAYRQLVMKYHPDKNDGNEMAEAHFKEIQEAYHILSDPSRRSAYNQQRWYRQSIRKQASEEPLTPDNFLLKCRKLSRYVATLDHRITEGPLYHYLLQLLTEDTVGALCSQPDTAIRNQVITELLKSSKPLSYRHSTHIATRLNRLSGGDAHMAANIQNFLHEQRLTGYWRRYRFMVILLLTLVICWLIFAISN